MIKDKVIDNEGKAERVIDAMACSWGKSPDYIAQRLDGWIRAGASLADVEAAFDQTERRRLETKIEDPVAYMHVSLRSTASGAVGGMRPARGMAPAGPPIVDTHDPDAAPPRMVWVRTNAPCNACELVGKGYRSSQVAAVEHTCGEMRPYVEVNRPAIEARREEARREGECRLCWGAGMRWTYELKGEVEIQLGGNRSTAFQDGRGIRRLVACPCRRGKR